MSRLLAGFRNSNHALKQCYPASCSFCSYQGNRWTVQEFNLKVFVIVRLTWL